MRYYTDPYLEHSLSSSVRSKISQALSGRVIKNHKYYQRVNVGKDKKGHNKYRYFYTKAEYDAYKKQEGQKVTGKDTREDTGKTFSFTLSYTSSSFYDYFNQVFDQTYHEEGVLLKLGKNIVDTILGIGYVKPYSIDVKRRGKGKELLTWTDKNGPTWNNPHAVIDKTEVSPEVVKFGKNSNDLDNKGHKYFARITLPNGKYRYFYSNKEYEAYVKSSKEFNEFGIHRQEYIYSDEEQVSNVNPSFNMSDTATYTNCWACATAYDLRNKGYDAQANVGDTDGATFQAISEQYYKFDEHGNKFPPDETSIKNNAYYSKSPNEYNNDYKWDNNLWSDFEKECQKQGKGSSGILCVRYDNGSAHALNYKYTDSGDIEIVDSQINYTYSGDEAKSYFSSPVDSKIATTDITIIRTDNAIADADTVLSTDPSEAKDMPSVIPSDDHDRWNDDYSIHPEYVSNPDGSLNYTYKIYDDLNNKVYNILG